MIGRDSTQPREDSRLPAQAVAGRGVMGISGFGRAAAGGRLQAQESRDGPLLHFLHKIGPTLSEIDLEADPARGILYSYMRHDGGFSVTARLLDDTLRLHRAIRSWAGPLTGGRAALRYHVWGSRRDGVFGLGGDLAAFVGHIRRGDRAALSAYARGCVEVVHATATGYGLPVRTIAMVQGDALGGGFESALSCHYIVAEARSRFGLPESIFNLFPGMGAYTFLERRIGMQQAERFILTAETVTAAELQALGLVEVLADDHGGPAAVAGLVDRLDRQEPLRSALLRVRDVVRPIDRAAMMAIAEIWVDAALRLDVADLQRMERLVRLQHRKSATTPCA